MLSSGVETQPVPLDSPMSAGAQELYTELPVSVSPELAAEFEPSVIPDAEPEASSSLVRTLPLEPQRTHVENCRQDADPMGDGEEAGCCGLAAGCAAGDLAASGVPAKERVEQEQEGRALRAPQEGLAEGQGEPAPAAAEGACGSCQVVLGRQRSGNPSEDEPRRTEENQGNIQVTTETLPNPTEEGQGMKVNGTKMISNAEPRSNKVSKSLPPGRIDCPDVDKIMTSGEVSETSTLVSLEPLTSVEPGWTKAPSTEKECETSSARPLWPPSPEDSASLPMYGEDILSKLSLDHEAVDNHHHNCGCDIESPSETNIPQAKSKEGGILPLKADPRGSCFPLSLPCVGSGSISLEECGCGDALQKMEKPFCTGEIPREEGPASRWEGEGVQSVRSKSSKALAVDTEPGAEESSTPPLNYASGQRGCALDSCCIHNPSQGTRSPQQENSRSPSEKDPMKGPSEIQENFKRHEGERVSCPCATHQDEDSIEESDSLVMQTEESEKTVSGHSGVSSKNVDGQNPGSLVSSQRGLGSCTEKRHPTACSVPDEPPTSVSKVSEVKSVLPQLQRDQKCDLADQPEGKEIIGISSKAVTPFVDGQRFASCPAESHEDKGKLLCVLSGKMSFYARDHKGATAPQESSLGGHAEEGTSEASQQLASSVLEDGVRVIANQQTILTQMRKGKDAFCPGVTTCHASSENHDVSAKAVSFNRVPNNPVIGKLAVMSGLEKEVAELSEEAPDLEHESAQSQGCHSHQRHENAPEGDMCSEGVTYKSTAISPEAENQSVLTSEDILVPRDPPFPETGSSLVGSILSVRRPLGENELSKEEIEDSLQEGKIKNEVASCSLLNRALNKSTLALSHVKPGNFIARSAGKTGLEENKLGTHSKEMALPCESHPSGHTVLESKLSSNIPSPEEPKDLCLTTACSSVRITNQADGTDQGLNCQSDLNGAVECWSESKSSKTKRHGMGIFEVQHTDSHKCEDVAKPNKRLSSSHKELLVKDLNNIQPSRSLPKKNIFKTYLGNEDFTVCRADPTQLGNKLREKVSEMKESDSAGSYRRKEEPSWLQPDRPLRSDQSQGGEGLIDQDSILPCASDSFNKRSLKTVPSHKGTPSFEQRDNNLRNEVSRESKTHGMESVNNHEQNTELSDTMSVLLESTHCWRIVEEVLPGETEGTSGGLRPQRNSAFDDEDSLEVYSKEPVLGSVETMPLHISSLENSATGPDGPLGEKAETKQLPESVNVKVLPELVRSSTVKTKVKKRGIPNIDTRGKRGTPGTFQPELVSSVAPSSSELNPGNKMDRRETGEHQGTLNDLQVREESEGKTWRADGGDKSSDAYRTYFKRKRICGETETRKAPIVQGCRCKGGQEGMQPKKRGTFSQQEESPNAKPCIRPTVGPSLQDSASQSRRKGHAHKQSTLKDITGAKVYKNEPFPQFLKVDDLEAGRRALHLQPNTESPLGPRLPISRVMPQDITGTGCEKTHNTFAMTPYQRISLLPLKKGLTITYHEPIKTGRKVDDVQKWIPLKNASETISVEEHKVFTWSSAALPSSASEANHMPKPKAMRRLLLNSMRLQKPTKESALLNKLSVLAGKLLAASTATQELGSQSCSAELLPVAETYKRLRFIKLQDESPYNMMQLNLHTGDYGCNKTLDSQTLALYPLEALRVGFLDLMNKMPSLQFSAQIFPISFHINLDSELTTDSTRIFSEHCSPPESAPGEDPTHPPQPPKWTFSFLMSQGSSGTATFREEDGLSCELLSHAALQTFSPEQAPGSNAIMKVRAGCSVLGLHTVLALSSPGCYRIWTRKRSLSSHLPTIQRLFMTQFTQGFKGLRPPASLSNSLFPSLPYSVGRVLSIWSQHGPSACPFEITPVHSKHSKWPPTLGIRNSHAVLPHGPLLGMEATTARTGGSPVRLGSPFSALVPKSRLAFEPVVSVLRLSASDFQIPAFKELRRVPAVCTSQHSSASQKEIESEKRPKKVSQIRIRKTIPRPDPNLTPMGLPRPKRLKKKEFSLEEIYTNKNYKSPPASRCLETIFEEPKERNGVLISISQQKRKRVLEFQDFTVPRKRRNRGKIKVTGSFTRAKKAALQSRELDALLIQKLMDLEAFLAKEGEKEPTSGC